MREKQILAIYRDPPTPSHKLSAMSAMTAPRDKELLARTFKFILTDEVKNQDFVSFCAGLASNRESRRDMWQFFQDNYDELVAKYKGNFTIGSVSLPRFISGVFVIVPCADSSITLARSSLVLQSVDREGRRGCRGVLQGQGHGHVQPVPLTRS